MVFVRIELRQLYLLRIDFFCVSFDTGTAWCLVSSHVLLGVGPHVM